MLQIALLAAIEDGAFRAIEYDLPETPLGWSLAFVVALLVVTLGVAVYLKDTRE